MKNNLFITLFFVLLAPVLIYGQTVTGPGGSFTPPATTSGVVSFPASAATVAGSTLTGGTCPGIGGAVISDLAVPAILGYNTEITNITLVNAQHTFAADLDLRLIAPDGTVLTFNTDNGGSTGLDVASDMCWDITATDCADNWTSSTSAAQPENCLLFETTENICGPITAPFDFVCGVNMGSIIGVEVNGVWTLEVTDDAGGDLGSFTSFSITFGPMTPPVVDQNGNAVDLLSCCVNPCNISSATAATTPTICGGDGTITITATEMGCTGALEYALDGGAFQPSNMFSGVAAGGHSVEVRCDADLTCTTTVAVSVSVGTDNIPPTIDCGAGPPDNYTIAPYTFSYTDITATGVKVADGDDNTSIDSGINGPINLGAPFTMYGVTYTQLTAGTNGYITNDLADTGGDLTNDCPLPSNLSTPSNGPGMRIYPLHDDLDSDPSADPLAGVYYQYFPVAPYTSPSGATTGASIFQWITDHFNAGGPAEIDFQAVLFDNGEIVFLYNLAGSETGSNSTTGIQSEGPGTPMLGTTVTCNTGGTITDGSATALIPQFLALNLDFPTDAGVCGANLTLPAPTALDNCALSGITNDFNGTANASGLYPLGTTVVTWTATDVSGNTTTCSQSVNVTDAVPPVITCPGNILVSCNEILMETAESIEEFNAQGGTIIDDCDVTLTVVEEVVGDVCPTTAQQIITRTYTATDESGNASTCTQTITLINSLNGPVITSIPLNQTVDCAVNAIPQPHLFIAEGDCGATISYSVSEGSGLGTPGCNGSIIQYTYTATDDCGRMASHVQRYTLMNDGPEFVCPVDICVIECPQDNDMIQAQFDAYADLATVITSCSENGYEVSNNFNPNGFFNQNCNSGPVAVANTVAWQTVTFTATDFCGRTSTCTALVVIKDEDGPVINGNIPLGIADCAEPNKQAGYDNWINLALSNLSAMDECTGTATNITYAPLSPNTNCSGGLATTDVVFTSTDACGNESTINAYYRIIDYGSIPMATVSGSLMTEEDEAVELVEVSVDGGSFSNMLMTSDNGEYAFDLELNQNHAITPSRNDNHLNGVTTYDLILMAQHLLEIQELDSPYKLIAADVNRSGSITALDLIQLRRLILQLDEEFTNNTSWRFVESNYVFPDLSNPFATTFPEAVAINNLSEASLHDFVAIKIGDLNGSVAPTLLAAQGDTRDRNDLVFQVDHQNLSTNQTHTVDFKAKDFKDILGYQFTLAFDPVQLEMIDFKSGAIELSAENFGDRAKEGVLTSSWNVFNPISIADEETLFSITFKANTNVNLSQAIRFNSELTCSEAYSQNESLFNLGLEFKGELNLDAPKFSLLQNRPNPFNNETLIAFNLPTMTTATLTIYDVAGRILKQYKGDFNKGYNEITVNRSDLSGAGLLYYQLETPTEVATMKMIVQ